MCSSDLKKKMTTVSQEPETVLAQADIPITREEKAEPAPKPENILAPEIAEEEESFIIARVPDEDDSEGNNEDNLVSDKPLLARFTRRWPTAAHTATLVWNLILLATSLAFLL